MALFNIADRVHEREGSALTQAKGQLKDAEGIINDLEAENERLAGENRRLKGELAGLKDRANVDAGVSAFAMELDKRTQMSSRIANPRAAMDVVVDAVNTYIESPGLCVGETVDAWRRRQIGR